MDAQKAPSPYPKALHEFCPEERQREFEQTLKERSPEPPVARCSQDPQSVKKGGRRSEEQGKRALMRRWTHWKQQDGQEGQWEWSHRIQRVPSDKRLSLPPELDKPPEDEASQQENTGSKMRGSKKASKAQSARSRGGRKRGKSDMQATQVPPAERMETDGGATGRGGEQQLDSDEEVLRGLADTETPDSKRQRMSRSAEASSEGRPSRSTANAVETSLEAKEEAAAQEAAVPGSEGRQREEEDHAMTDKSEGSSAASGAGAGGGDRGGGGGKPAVRRLESIGEGSFRYRIDFDDNGTVESCVIHAETMSECWNKYLALHGATMRERDMVLLRICRIGCNANYDGGFGGAVASADEL